REGGAASQREGHECPDARGGKPEIGEIEGQKNAEIAVCEGPHGLGDEDGDDFAIGTEPAHVVASLKRETTCWGLTVTQRLLSILTQGPTGPEVSYELGGSRSLRRAHASDGSSRHDRAGRELEHVGSAAAPHA